MEIILNKLEYYEVIKILEKYCKTYLGKKYCSKLVPSFDFQQVKNLLLETTEATNLLHEKGNPPLFEISEMEKYIKLLESTQILSIKALLDIANLLKLSRQLREYFYENGASNLLIEKYFSNLYSNFSIEKNIFEKIIDENTIADNASSKLSSLRRNKKELEQEIRDKLNMFIHSSTYAKYIMEPIITIRNNRFVIPVKEEYRNTIKGFIHDTSSSGSTLYIEPTSVFELNNKINRINIEEDIEIEKILQSLSASLYRYHSELTNNLFNIGMIDLIFAKALYGVEFNAICPILNTDKIINFYKARHPLIDTATVVPIDISIGEDYTSLLITGPNTGGKTVALKTIGVLLLMAYSGIPIPCNEKTNIYVFSKIFADIGDEQSIQQSLSTFSAHMKNIINIINHSNYNSLVLLDELGSGTDPLEGSALAISILKYLQNSDSLVCCTTHYQELKEFALVTDGFENASFEFDVENLKPTFRLLIGIPGKSNAFAISKKLGLLPEILEDASSLLKDDNISIEELLKSIYNDKLIIEKQKEEIEKNLLQAESLRKSLENQKDDTSQKRLELIEKAKLEARSILLSAKEDANEIIHSLSNTTDLKQANNLRNTLNDKIKDISRTEHSLNTNMQDEFDMLDKSQIKKGVTAYIPLLQSNAIILSDNISKSEEVQVQVGNMKMNIKLSELRKSKDNSSSSIPIGTITSSKENKSKKISPEINVIGQNVEEAIYSIDKYLDNCIVAHLSPVRIIHGKGTGKLREGIHTYLKKHPGIKSYRIGTFGEGEMGVTVIELK